MTIYAAVTRRTLDGKHPNGWVPEQKITVEEAVRNVGLSAVRDIATSVGIIDAFPSDGADGFNILRCWQHCFAVSAILQRLLARSLTTTASCDGVSWR